jgi:hypothetical protein
MRWIAVLCAGLRTLVISALAGSGASQAQQPTAPDDAAWDAARRADTIDAFQSYLEQFPTGHHVEDAFRSLIEQQVESELGTAAANMPSRGVAADPY